MLRRTGRQSQRVLAGRKCGRGCRGRRRCRRQVASLKSICTQYADVTFMNICLALSPMHAHHELQNVPPFHQ